MRCPRCERGRERYQASLLLNHAAPTPFTAVTLSSTKVLKPPQMLAPLIEQPYLLDSPTRRPRYPMSCMSTPVGPWSSILCVGCMTAHAAAAIDTLALAWSNPIPAERWSVDYCRCVRAKFESQIRLQVAWVIVGRYRVEVDLTAAL